MAYREYEPQRSRDRIRFEMKEHIGVLSTKDNGWRREVNIVAWNGGVDKLDIREWDPNHERMTKGVTLFEEEAETLAMALADRYGLRLTDNNDRNRMAGSRPATAVSGQTSAGNDAAFSVEPAHNDDAAFKEASVSKSRSSFGVRTAPPAGKVSHGRVFTKWGETETADTPDPFEHKSASDTQGDTIPFECEGGSSPRADAVSAGCDNDALIHEVSAAPECGDKAMAVAESTELETADNTDDKGEADEACGNIAEAEPAG